MSNWQKGYIFVNGYNLGRYWNKGPQQKVFCPGVWLKKGVNDFVVMELLADKARFIKGDHNLMVGDEQIYHKKHNTTVDMEKDKKEEA
jgi:beta-galactosidase